MMENKGSFIKEIVWFFTKALIIVIILVNFVLMPCVVNGTSMFPTYKQGDFGYSFIISKTLGINRFDTVVIKVNNDNNEKLLVKRVIGMPNETIEYKDNKLYINGEYIEESFLKDTNTQDFKEKLGDNEYFCMGDNRSVSRDSRFYGAFNIKQIRSTHLLIIYPFSDFGFNR